MILLVLLLIWRFLRPIGSYRRPGLRSHALSKRGSRISPTADPRAPDREAASGARCWAMASRLLSGITLGVWPMRLLPHALQSVRAAGRGPAPNSWTRPIYRSSCCFVGTGHEMKVTLIFLASLFPILLNTYSGVRPRSTRMHFDTARQAARPDHAARPFEGWYCPPPVRGSDRHAHQPRTSR